MKTRMLLLASIIAAGTALVTGETATAQSLQNHMGPGMMPGSADQQPPDHEKMQGGMMGHGMMCSKMPSGMMQGGMMQGGMMQGGMGALFGSRVKPVMNLSVDDVRGYLAAQLGRLNNKRLKIGNIDSGDGTITADIVTLDNSLVQRSKVDRRTGAITYEN